MKRVELGRGERGRRTASPWRRVAATMALATALLIGLATQAQAATFTVGTTSDLTGTCDNPAGGTCSLRQLINSVAAGSTISVPAGTYILSQGPLVITHNLTVAGAGARTTTVEQNPPAGSPTARVFEIRPDPTSGVKPTVTISGLEILFGKADSTNGSSGGNILNQGTLTLKEDDLVLGETTGGAGAAIANQNGTLTVTHSLLENNLSFKDANGSGGTAGAIDSVASGLTTATVTIDNSTIASNTAQSGAGALVSRCVRCTGSSIAVTNSTVAFNDGGTATTNAGGLIAATGATISVLNSIIASNTVSNGATFSNCAGTISSLGHNIETAADCGFTATGDRRNTDPQFLFGGVSDMGGNTDTIPLSAGSPAVDAIPSSASNCTKTTDQRDIGRPQGSNCDIGAYELVEPVEGAQFSEVVGRIDNTSATIDWGDGTAQSQGSVNTKKDNQVTGTHTYAEAGTYHGTLHWLNSDGKPSQSPFDVIVTDAPLSAAGSPFTAVAGTAFSGQVATFTDGNPLATASDFTATINWGDGTAATAGTVATNAGGGFKVTGTHTYSLSGSFTTTVTINDVGGSTASASDTATVNPPRPTVTSVSPSAGPTAGHTTVTITGTNLGGATAVKFGANAATIATNTATQIVATNPAGSAGTVDVTVTNAGGTSATSSADQFTYNAPIVLPPATSPVVLTGAPSVHGSNAAGLEGSVNPQGLITTAHYEYGLDSKFRASGGPVYDQSTPSQNVGSDFSDHTVVASLSGLVPNALYHVRLVATNSAGTTFGPDATFTTKTDPPPPAPKLGGSFNAQPVNGLVLVEINGKFVPLTEVRQIPNGAIVNALHGTLVLITSAGGSGPANVSQAARSRRKKPKVQAKTQKGTFGGAVFKITQDHSGLATLSLVEGASFPGAPTYASCKAQSGNATVAALSKTTLQLLHGSDNHGKFRTKGRYAAATVRGTVWSIADRCDGTLTHVTRGTVVVSDLVRHESITVRAGHSYLALAKPPRHK